LVFEKNKKINIVIAHFCRSWSNHRKLYKRIVAGGRYWATF